MRAGKERLEMKEHKLSQTRGTRVCTRFGECVSLAKMYLLFRYSKRSKFGHHLVLFCLFFQKGAKPFVLGTGTSVVAYKIACSSHRYSGRMRTLLAERGTKKIFPVCCCVLCDIPGTSMF